MRHCTDRRKNTGSDGRDWLAGCVERHGWLAGDSGCDCRLVRQLRLKKDNFSDIGCTGLVFYQLQASGQVLQDEGGEENVRVWSEVLLLHRKDERTLSSVIPDTGCCRVCTVGTAVYCNCTLKAVTLQL